MAKILICNEKEGEIFIGKTPNLFLHLHIGAKSNHRWEIRNFHLLASQKT